MQVLSYITRQNNLKSICFPNGPRSLIVIIYRVKTRFKLNRGTQREYSSKPLKHKGRHTRGSLLLKHAPDTRSRVSTPTSTHEGHDEGAEWWNNPIGAWELLWMKKISQFDWPTGDTSCHGKQISVHTRELAPETDPCNRFAPGACSLISNQFDMREQN